LDSLINKARRNAQSTTQYLTTFKKFLGKKKIKEGERRSKWGDKKERLLDSVYLKEETEPKGP